MIAPREKGTQEAAGRAVSLHFTEISTAFLNALRRAVSCSFSLPPVDKRCLKIKKEQQQMSGIATRLSRQSLTPW